MAALSVTAQTERWPPSGGPRACNASERCFCHYCYIIPGGIPPPPPIGIMDVSNIPPADGLPSDGGVVSNKETLFGGRAVYYKEDRAHILVVHRDGVKFLVTPPKDASGLLIPMKTSEFLDTYKLSIAINGGGFTLQADGSAKPKGFVMSKGRVYSDEIDGVTMYIRRNNTVAFSRPTGTIYQAVSGDRMLVEKGIPTPGEENTVSPRTAIGLSRGEARLILLVVDGNEAEGTGATYAEIAALIKKYGAYKAMALDGGGSSTMVVKDKDGPRILNIPSDDNVPGRERPVATHLGIAFKKKRKKED